MSANRLNELNPAQREAVTILSGPLLVLAGAGTGKTRVITYRMAELIRRGAPADRILSVTFTNKAAREMHERTANLLGKRLKQKPLICTFHSLCVKILRVEAEAIGYPKNFSICDRGDQESAARTALRDCRVGDKTMKPADLLNRISRWKMGGIGPSHAAEHVDNDGDFLAAVAYRRYQANLRAAATVDFDDLLLLTLELFQQSPESLARQQRRFDHVQIDEYQDTNRAQFEIVEALVEGHNSLCAVGDDDQSIYGWRGADVEHILGFASHFPGAKVVRLQDNYRSNNQILELANRLVRHNVDRHDKVLVPHKRAERAVRFFEAEDETQEAELVVGEIHSLITDLREKPSDIAILFRTNEQPRVFETELRRRGVRYQLVGGQSFFDRKEIRDLLAYLKVISNPVDEVSLLRIINVPARGIGTATVETLLARAVRDRASLWEVVSAAVEAGEISLKAAQKIGEFQHLLERYREQFRLNPDHLDGTLAALIEEIDYTSEIQKQYKNADQHAMREGMLDQLIEAVREYRARTPEPSLAGFLEETTLAGRDEEFKTEEDVDTSSIRLMTLHSAKGLEFPHVYMVGLEEGILPHHRSLDGAESAISEERRLAYVGVTRAMDHLTITRAASRMKWGKRRPSIPSRFLFEMRGDGVDDDAPLLMAQPAGEPAPRMLLTMPPRPVK